jgi:hypothetical protein
MTLNRDIIVSLYDSNSDISRLVVSWYDGEYTDLLLYRNYPLLRRLVLRAIRELQADNNSLTLLLTLRA